MWVTIIAIVLVVAMIVGPVMMVQPSQYQRRRGKLRTMAAEKDIRVKLGKNPGIGEPQQIAIYSKVIDVEQLSKPIQPWCVGRQYLEHEINLVADWDWIGEKSTNKKLRQKLVEWLPTLPAAIRVVEVTPHSVALYWTESCWQKESNWDASANVCLNYIADQLQMLYEANC